jgi:cytochrome b
MRLSMRVWDLPIRLFHAAVTLLLIAAVVTARTHHLRWHIRIGETLLVLLVWRIVWGFVGSDTARFRAFLGPPLARLSRNQPDDGFGHAQAGGWWVLVMLALIATQLLSGLLLRRLGPRPHAIAAWLLLAAIVLHLLMLVIAAIRTGENPLRLMLSGKKRLPAALRSPRMAGNSLAALVLLCAAGGVILVLNELSR